MTISRQDKAEIDRLSRHVLIEEAMLARVQTQSTNANLTKAQKQTLREQADRIYDRLQQYLDGIIDRCEVADIQTYQDQITRISETYETIKVTLYIPPPDVVAAAAAATATATPPHTSEIRLPKIDLPKFYGELTEWREFADLFKVSVDSNQHLNDAQKMQYLKSSLRGEAARLLQHLSVTEANYKEAWDLLTERYENEREIIYTHIRNLLQLQPPQKDISLRRFVDETKKFLRALKALNQPVDEWNALLNVVTLSKLDPTTIREWEITLKDKKVPKHDTLLEFLEIKARAYANSQASQQTSITRSQIPAKGNCPVCKGDHFLNQCERFQQMTISDKKRLIIKLQGCLNCLSTRHPVEKCKAGNCKKCNRKHHTSLHQENKTEQAMVNFIQGDDNTITDESDEINSVIVNHTTVEAVSMEQVKGLLPTALVNAANAQGQYIMGRTLVDFCSQFTLVKEKFFKQLQLRRYPTGLHLKGVATSATPNGKTVMSLASTIDDTFKFETTALIVKTITTDLPSKAFSIQGWEHLQGLKLADPNFNVPGEIDMILGVSDYARIIREGIRRAKNDKLPIAQETSLGWIIMGDVDSFTDVSLVNHVSAEQTLEQTLQKFWELETIPVSKHLTAEERACENHFKETHERLPNGSYQVSLPLYAENAELGNSKAQAMQRLGSLERKFKRNPEFKREYVKCMNEYLTLNHMEPAPPATSALTYYIPHHAVIKESLTTKLRIVFDASARSTNGKSLNDIMMNGPRLQDDIFNILLLFRCYAIVLTADIEKMYRQVHIDPMQADLQRILWRENDDEPIKEYRLNRLTFGTKAAPYLAVRVLHQLAEDEKKRYPLASIALEQHFYVDDLLTGTDSKEEARELLHQLISITRAGGFQLRKWMSNEPSVLKELSSSDIDSEFLRIDDESSNVKTLGLQWSPSSDAFSFSVNVVNRQNLTKRTLLSDASKIFDPLGWLSPVTVKGKILFQKLWLTPLSWDDSLPQSIHSSWIQYQDDLRALNSLKIPRRITVSNSHDQTLCGFSDASEDAYAAVVYLRSVTSTGQVNVALVAAKTKVAPLKTTSVPRLELNAALLLSRLLRTISSTINIHQIEAWTDSTVVLSWIAAEPSSWKTYVANRVAEIQEVISPIHWHHVNSQDNPADCASRGITATQFIDKELWWSGPTFLLNNDFKHNQSTVTLNYQSAEVTKEMKRAKVSVNFVREIEPIYRSSSFRRTIRVTAYVFRAIHNFRYKKDKITGPLTIEELYKAEVYHIRMAQATEYESEIRRLLKNKSIKATSKILNLTPFLDDNQILRVGGRISKAAISFNAKHPILLPTEHSFTRQIIEQYHKDFFHANSSLIRSIVRYKYWIPRVKNLIRKIIHDCVTCTRFAAKNAIQQMADLPAPRVTPSRPFTHTGVDYAGPFTIRSMTPRSTKTSKGYIALFICFAVKAIHLEVVSDMTTPTFIAALHRFISRRGQPSVMYSDCGSNLKGADNELRQLLNLAHEEISSELSKKGIKWQFNPPAAPHFGGIWEAGVKSFKYHFYRVVGNTILNFEEMTTLAAQIEACLNSRPLTPMNSEDLDSLEVLTPGHFLVGSALTAPPEPDLTHLKLNRLSRWQLVQSLKQNLWRRWSSDYLNTLQQRYKWQEVHPNVKEGQMVLIRKENARPAEWDLARIVQIHPDSKDQVRVVTVKTAEGLFKRPIVKLIPLPVN